MNRLELPSDGQCRCGEVQIRITVQPILTMACHCKGCQRMSASAFALSAAIPTRGFEVIRGEPVLGGLRNPDLRHFFCPLCMTWMFTRFLPEFVNVRATMLEDVSWFAPFVETCTKTRLPSQIGTRGLSAWRSRRSRFFRRKTPTDLDVNVYRNSRRRPGRGLPD